MPPESLKHEKNCRKWGEAYADHLMVLVAQAGVDGVGTETWEVTDHGASGTRPVFRTLPSKGGALRLKASRRP
jgi:hypothetical protein